MPDHGPGAADLQTPTLAIRKCPQCGEKVEVFSTDAVVKCTRCGFVLYHDMESCIPWCRHAKECLGDEMFQKPTREKKRCFIDGVCESGLKKRDVDVSPG